MKTRNELKEQAKTALRGNWPWAVGVLWVPTLVLIVVFGILLGVISLVWKAATADFTASSNVVLIFIVMAFLMLALFTFFASIGISAGATYAYLDVIRGRKQSFREAATYAFKEQRFDSIFGVVLMTVIYTLLWMVLLIIPGYMKAMAYSQGLFILKDDMETGKGITTTSAITKSKILMEGHNKDYFILILSFLGWALVPIAFCGLAVALFVSHQIGWAIFCLALYILGLAILVPYVTTTQAAFYEDLIHQEQPEEIAQLEEKLADAKLEADKTMADYNGRVAERKADKKKAHDEKMAKKLDAKKEREEKRREKVAKKRQEREGKEAKKPKKKSKAKADKKTSQDKKPEKSAKKSQDSESQAKNGADNTAKSSAKPEASKSQSKKDGDKSKESATKTEKSETKPNKGSHSSSKKPKSKSKAKKKKGKKRK